MSNDQTNIKCVAFRNQAEYIVRCVILVCIVLSHLFLIKVLHNTPIQD